MRDLLQEVLEEAGHETVVAVDGRAALNLIQQQSDPLDLVITDVQMPNAKGDEILRAVRERLPREPQGFSRSGRRRTHGARRMVWRERVPARTDPLSHGGDARRPQRAIPGRA